MIYNNSMNSDGIGSKRKALEMITNIFCKKSKDSETNSVANGEPNGVSADHCSVGNHCQPCLSVPESDNRSFCDILSNSPNSPISPRSRTVKNIREDMEALMLSRHDNPYIMHQLERLSTKDSDILSEAILTAHSSPARNSHKISVTNLTVNGSAESNFVMDNDIIDAFEDNLHEKLIRSPPPQFPKNMSLFLFPSCAPSVHNLRSGDVSDSMSSRLHSSLSPHFNPHSTEECKNSSIADSPNDSRSNFKRTHLLEPGPNYSKYERRGSDSSIMSNNWKTAFLNQSMTASSSSLLSFVPRRSPINSCISVSNDSNMSVTDCQISDSSHKSAADLMEVYPHIEDTINFMSPSNSREALLKDISQIS